MKLKRKPELRDWLNITLIIIIIGVIVWLGNEYTRVFGAAGGDLASSAENLRQLLLSYGPFGIWVLIFLHVFHVVVSFVPAVIVQFGGGVVYGMLTGMLAGYAGMLVGTTISFYLSRLLGRRVVTLFVDEKTIHKLDGLISGNISAIALFLLFLIPFPKDFIAYFIGLTKMRFDKFLLIDILGRTPGMLISTYMGAHILDKNYALIIGMIILCLVLTLITYICRHKILAIVAGKR